MLAAFAHADNQIATEPAKLRVCVLELGSAEFARQRFANLYAPTRVVKTSRELANCQLAIMPSEWYGQRGAFEEGMRPALEAWVKRGGALIVFQPNPPDQARIELFDTWFVVNNWYDPADAAKKLVEHPVLANLTDEDLPFPADRILAVDDEHWTPLVAGTRSQGVSLLVGTFGKGRVAVDTANPAASISPTAKHTDRFLRALVAWLVKKP